MSKKKIIIILVVLALGVGLFVFKTGGNKNPVTNEMANAGDNGLANDFIKALMGVENVSLDTSLLNSSVFKSLVPSGAYVDPNPNRGKPDPFSAIANNIEPAPSDIPENSPRDFGGLQAAAEPVQTVPVQIKVSKITATTAYISATGIPKNKTITASVSGPNNFSIPGVKLTYKDANSEYGAVVTGLATKSKYTVAILSPDSYAGLQADFQTK